MRVLLVMEPSEDRDRLAFGLEGKYQAIVEAVDRVPAQLAAAEGGVEPFSLIVLHLPASDEPIHELARSGVLRTTDRARRTPVILCTPDGNVPRGMLPFEVGGTASVATLMSDTFAAFERLFGVGARSSGEEAPSYVKIRTRLLLSICPLKTDVYIRLSESKYLKLFAEGVQFDRSDWEKYTVKKGVDYLYIKSQECQEFVEKYRVEVERNAAKIADQGLGAALGMATSIHETVRELGLRIGFTKDVQLLAKEQIRATLLAMRRSPSLADLLSRLEAQSGEYISMHSTLTGAVGCAIASHLEWGSELTFQKLNFASFLHDITLENHELAKCESVAQAQASGFSASEIAVYQNHPRAAAALSARFTEVPPDVDTILLQHHEQADGKGFPRGLSHSYIAPLSSVFIVAHEIADEVIRHGFHFDLPAFEARMGERFSSGPFKKVMRAVGSSLRVNSLVS